MTTGTVHELADDLFLVEGHHPHNLWDDPDLPSVGLFRSGRRLYLLDTGVGPEQREGILDIAGRYAGALDEVILLNSHGHLDHLGNNDVLPEVAALTGAAVTRHYFPREARPALDFAAFFGGMYRRGLPYFDYLSGLTLPPGAIASLLRALGASRDLSAEDVAGLGSRMAALGVSPALSGFLPSVVVDILLQTYPPVFPSVQTMTDYEDLGDATPIDLAGTQWSGWTFTDRAGTPDVHVLRSGGHSAGGVVFSVPGKHALFMADETTSVPIWADSDPRKAMATGRRVLALLEAGEVRVLCAGHRPMLPVTDDDAKEAIWSMIGSGQQFADVVDDMLDRHPEGLTIDRLYDLLVAEATPDSVVTMLHRLQFPVFSTFLKLTLLNHCLLHELPEDRETSGRPMFRTAGGRSRAADVLERPVSGGATLT